MNTRIPKHLIICFALITLACSKDDSSSQRQTEPEQALVTNSSNNQGSASSSTMGAKQISGTGFFDANDECNVANQGATFAVKMTGDLEGCLYVYVDFYECSPSGTYREIGREKFVGTYNGGSGSFWTAYRFEGKYEGCSPDGSYLGAEILGRCQHPIVDGSGEGVFSGVSGRVDMKDDIEAGNYPYRGHFRF
ncbi:MAG TPA: hypothetical protein VK166_07945 [Chitinophagaceae bacterium]|nr:hypothetical protein [Chitinophagaceae bacterium]